MATREDPQYLKGWWRLGNALTALQRPEDSLEALTKAECLDPSNKALIKEIKKVKKQVEEGVLAKEVKGDGKNGASFPTPVVPASSKASCGGNKSSDTMDVDNDDDSKLFTKSEPIRGYKVVNGKKTSYFHNELDEKSKALIGDIAPKKIENLHPNPAPGIQNSKIQGTSAWNQNGVTWEERDVTKWAKESLTQLLLQATYILPSSSPAPSAVVTVEKLSSMSGHASVAVVRGKQRFIYEFCCKLEWQLQKDDLKCNGTLAIPDIDGTIALGEGYEIHNFSIDSVTNNSIKPVIDRFVHRGGFHEALNEKIDEWVRLFRSEFS